MSNLAILGGDAVIAGPLPPYRSMGERERAAVIEVVESDCLSGFFGSPGPRFQGGPRVLAFEEAWRQHYAVDFAVSVNSATSGLYAAMGAIGIGPGDEVIVPPWTMSATAMAPLIYGAIPVFADVEPDYFCIDPRAARAEITPRTRAIVAVNLFGHPAALRELRELADERGIFLIEDNAQAPSARENGRPCGTIGHLGVFSLNYHKHIHTGEGGMCVTNDETLARRLRLIRNHAENAVEWMEMDDLANMVGFNFRMTELSAAVGMVQLAAIDEHVGRRQRLAEALSEGVRDLDGLTPPPVRDGCTHDYYCWTVRYDVETMNVSRQTFSDALAAEGFPHSLGYVPPLYLLPLFRERTAIGGGGFPFTLTNRSYGKGLCPITERLHEKEAMVFQPCAFTVDDEVTEKLAEALRKVHAAAPELAAYDREKGRAD